MEKFIDFKEQKVGKKKTKENNLSSYCSIITFSAFYVSPPQLSTFCPTSVAAAAAAAIEEAKTAAAWLSLARGN